MFHSKHSQKDRANARSYANCYQRRGILVPKPCERCGTTDRVEKHHEDYSKPLQVRWMCRLCHMAEHGVRHNPPPLERGAKQLTVWGDYSPSQYKPRYGTVCSRPGCDAPRRKGGRYCRSCTNAWRRAARAKSVTP